jgi:hypothetical protein
VSKPTGWANLNGHKKILRWLLDEFEAVKLLKHQLIKATKFGRRRVVLGKLNKTQVFVGSVC